MKDICVTSSARMSQAYIAYVAVVAVLLVSAGIGVGAQKKPPVKAAAPLPLVNCPAPDLSLDAVRSLNQLHSRLDAFDEMRKELTGRLTAIEQQLRLLEKASHTVEQQVTQPKPTDPETEALLRDLHQWVKTKKIK